MNTLDLRDALLTARREQQALVPTTAHAAALADVDAACAVQHASGVALQAWAPNEVPGYWKSGAGHRQAALTHAPLMPAGVHADSSLAQPADLRPHAFFKPAIECEIALRLACAVTPAQALAMTHDDEVTGLIDAMAVSIEVVDCRWVDDGALPPLLRLADFQSHGALALGPWAPWRETDWSQQHCALHVNDAPVVERKGSHPLGRPAWLLPIWLRHLTRHGATVPAGTVVTTGTWTGLTPVQRGSRVQVRFAGLGEAALVL
ncbi:MAG: fumarylacetoacetate hydrolase family protein [Vitreoscilla sp.]|nr:fumarylacetoacetate hydrolase family protein [Vitreoscilla sp.]